MATFVVCSTMLAGDRRSLSLAGDGGVGEPKRRKMVNAINKRQKAKSFLPIKSGHRVWIMTASRLPKVPGKGHGRRLQSKNTYHHYHEETPTGASILTTDMGFDPLYRYFFSHITSFLDWSWQQLTTKQRGSVLRRWLLSVMSSKRI